MDNDNDILTLPPNEILARFQNVNTAGIRLLIYYKFKIESDDLSLSSYGSLQQTLSGMVIPTLHKTF